MVQFWRGNVHAVDTLFPIPEIVMSLLRVFLKHIPFEHGFHVERLVVVGDGR